MTPATNIIAIFGKVLNSYDSWNGDHKTITISKIEFIAESNEFKFSGIGYWGNEQNIYVPKEKVEVLLETGRASSDTTIDHCSIRKEWSMS